MTAENAPPGPDEPACEDERVTIEIGRGVEWLCEPEMAGWRTTAAGFDGPMDYPAWPS